MAVKRIMRYLKGTDDFGLYYKRTEKFELKAYIDANQGGNIDDKEAPVEEHSFQVEDQSLGLEKRKVVPQNPQLKLNMLLLP